MKHRSLHTFASIQSGSGLLISLLPGDMPEIIKRHSCMSIFLAPIKILIVSKKENSILCFSKS